MNFQFLNSKYFKILASVALLIFYFSILFGFGLILLIIGFTYYAYSSEKKKIESGDEKFKNDNLFFSYGIELSNDTVSIPVKQDWTAEDSLNFGNSIIKRIQDKLHDSIGVKPLKGKLTLQIIGATDKDRPNEPRGFLKIYFTGNLGAVLTQFITFQTIGKNLVFHKMIFLLGIAHWYDKLFFFLTSPFTFLFWIVTWIRGEYSIYSVISRGIANSFEVLDLRAFLTSSREVISEAFITVLKEHDLYTEDLMLTVNNNFNNIYHTNHNYGNQIVGGTGNSIIGQIK